MNALCSTRLVDPADDTQRALTREVTRTMQATIARALENYPPEPPKLAPTPQTTPDAMASEGI